MGGRSVGYTAKRETGGHQPWPWPTITARPQELNTKVHTLRAHYTLHTHTHTRARTHKSLSHASATVEVIAHRMYHSTQPSGKKSRLSGKGSAKPHVYW